MRAVACAAFLFFGTVAFAADYAGTFEDEQVRVTIQEPGTCRSCRRSPRRRWTGSAPTTN
jgi:hypothetical protein